MPATKYDLIIIGAGPAGLTAAIYAARREMKTLIIAKDIGGQMLLASEIENYPGFLRIASFKLISQMQAQVENLGVPIKLDEVKEINAVTAAAGNKELFAVFTEKEKFFAKTLLIALGLSPRRLAIKGEKRLAGRGVSYCANCDVPLFKGQTVAVIGGGNSALDAAEMLSKIAAKVILIHNLDNFQGFEILVEKVKAKNNIEIKLKNEVQEIRGKDKVESLLILNKKTGKTFALPVTGVFVEIGHIAQTDLVAGLVKRNQQGKIIIDVVGRTSRPGIFAAGDVTQIPFKQITIACGQATAAALAAYQYLQLKGGQKPISVFDRGPKA